MHRIPPGRASALLLLLIVAAISAPFAAAPAATVAPPVAASGLPPPPSPSDAVLAAAMAASPARPTLDGLVTFAVLVSNNGTSSAVRAWVNDTLPAGLAYVSDTASQAGASTPYPSFTFADLTPGAHAFALTARVEDTVPPGTTITNTATLEYTNATGAIQTAPSAQAGVTVGLVTKPLYLTAVPPGIPTGLSPDAPSGPLALPVNVPLPNDGSTTAFTLSQSLTRSFDVGNATATLYLGTSSGNAGTIALALSLYDSGTLVTSGTPSVTFPGGTSPLPYTLAFAPVAYTFAGGHAVTLQVTNRASGSASAYVAANGTSTPSHLSLLTDTYVRVDTITLGDANGPTLQWSPRDALLVRATVSDPFGIGEIDSARVNVTAPGGGVAANYAPMVNTANDTGTNPAWRRYEFRLNPPLANGTYEVVVIAREGNGALGYGTANATVRAPAFSLVKTASVAQAKSGQRFTYTIYFNNTGTGAAGRVWINDTLPPELTFVSSPNATAIPNTPSWIFTNVALGSHWVAFDARVQGSTTAAFVTNVVSLDFMDAKGFFWPTVVARHDLVINGPAVSLGVSSSPGALVHPNETVVLTITLTNRGDAARTLWLNVTLPAGLAYLSNTSNPAWGAATPTGTGLACVFANMPGAGTVWRFTVTSRASSGLPRNTTLTTSLGLNSTNVNGVLMPPRSASTNLVVASPSIATASLGFAYATAVPGQVLLLRVTTSNAGNEPARTAWINLTLDPAFGFLGASVPATFAVGDLRLTASAVPMGPWTAYVNLSLGGGVADRQLLSANGSLAYTDGAGNPMPAAVLPATSVRVALSLLALTATPGASRLEAGTAGTFEVALDNSGSGATGAVWLNVTLPAGLTFLSDNATGTRSAVGSAYTWSWPSLAPGPVSFVLRLLAAGSAANGTTGDMTFRAEYVDAAGAPQPALTSAVHVDFVAPAIALGLGQSTDRALPGSDFEYTLAVRNDGSTSAAYVNLTDALDLHLAYLSYVADVPMDVALLPSGAQSLSWNFTDLPAGGQKAVTLKVRIAEGAPAQSLIANTIEARYANSLGTPIGYVRSNPTLLKVDADLSVLLAIVAIGAGAGAALVLYVWRRGQVQIEEVFLVTRDGILISHLSRTMVQDKDRDQLSGMLTAVQDFVKDAFTYSEHRELHQMEFGDYHILIEQGSHAYLAVVYRGTGTAGIRRKARAAMDAVEAAYGGVLEGWDGNMDTVLGARDILRNSLLVGRQERLRTKSA